MVVSLAFPSTAQLPKRQQDVEEAGCRPELGYMAATSCRLPLVAGSYVGEVENTAFSIDNSLEMRKNSRVTSQHFNISTFQQINL